MQRGQRVYFRELNNPLSRLTLLFVEERLSLHDSGRKIVVVHVQDWKRNLFLWKEDVYNGRN